MNENRQLPIGLQGAISREAMETRSLAATTILDAATSNLKYSFRKTEHCRPGRDEKQQTRPDRVWIRIRPQTDGCQCDDSP
jgi:hypothetical protein